MKRWLLLLLFSALGFAQSPYVTITGIVQGPNGLPVANNVISLTPTQNFFVAGTGGGGGGGITGSGVANQVAVWSGPTALTGFSGFTFISPTLTVPGLTGIGAINFSAASSLTIPIVGLSSTNQGVLQYNTSLTTVTFGTGSNAGVLPFWIVGTPTVGGDCLIWAVSSSYQLSQNVCSGYVLPNQYAKLRCESGLGDGLNAISAGTYLQSFCYNDSGVTWTVTGLKCYVDGGSSSTLNAAGNSLGPLLTGAIACSSSFASGTQTTNVSLNSGDYIKFTFVADGTAKQSTWVVSMSQ